MNIEQARFNMIEQHVKPWKIFDQNLLGAMAIIPREQFVSDTQRGLAYADVHLPLAHQQAMLAPREIARLIQALELKGQERVLEIGTGSGYSAALLSRLAKQIVSVDIIDEFVKMARKAHKKLALDNLIVEEGDASDGWLAHAPYDAILITAVLPKLPESLKRNITQQGRIVCLLDHKTGHMATLAQLDDESEWQYEYLFPVDGTRMINAEASSQFTF